MMDLDTGKCAPESHQTLLLQQEQLVRGKRDVQMFPSGTAELPIPHGCNRFQNSRGIYHFRNVSADTIKELSERGRENEFLLLGPFSKSDIYLRLEDGERSTYITEYVSGVELRCAIGTDRTIGQQREYFGKTKEPDGIIAVGECPDRVQQWLAASEAQALQKAMRYGH